jgi:hypothetical protein
MACCTQQLSRKSVNTPEIVYGGQTHCCSDPGLLRLGHPRGPAIVLKIQEAYSLWKIVNRTELHM